MDAVSLQFSAADDPGSWAIRQYDHGPWSHVDAILPDGRLLGARSDVLAGVPAGVQIRPPNYFNFHSTKRLIIPTTSDIAGAYYDFLQKQLGKPYDKTAIMGFVFQRDWREADSWFCSELQGSAGEATKLFPHRLATTSNKLTPNGLFLACSVLIDVWN